MFPEHVETDSLVLRPLTPEHVDVMELYDCYRASREGSAEVFRYVPQDPHDTPKDAHDLLESAANGWSEVETATYAVRPDEETLAGTAALSAEWDHRRGNVAVILARQHWGNGYAGECARAMTELGLGTLDLAVVTLGYDEGNERSKAAIESFVESVGGQFDGVERNATVREDGIVDAYIYSVTREEFRDATGE